MQAKLMIKTCGRFETSKSIFLVVNRHKYGIRVMKIPQTTAEKKANLNFLIPFLILLLVIKRIKNNDKIHINMLTPKKM